MPRLADDDVFGLANHVDTFVRADLFKSFASVFNQQCKTGNPDLIHQVIRAIADDRCRFGVLDQVDFGGVLGIGACGEDVMGVNADLIFGETQQRAIRFIGSGFEGRNKTQYIAVELEGLINVRDGDANVKQFLTSAFMTFTAL